MAKNKLLPFQRRNAITELILIYDRVCIQSDYNLLFSNSLCFVNFRRTKVAACETLHVFVIYMIGKEASNPDSDQQFANAKLYERVFPAMLKLAGDEDTVVGTLFYKLMIQM